MRRIAMMLATVLLGTLLSIFGVSPAAADTVSCDQPVVDEANVLVDSQVQASIDRLENLGADVRVRSFATAPFGKLEAYERNQATTCASWGTPDGNPKFNLVVVVFSMDRQSAIFYGGNWHAGLDSNVDRIRSSVLNAQLKSGNYTGAVTGTLDEINRALDAQLHPYLAPYAAPQAAPVAAPSQPFNWSGLATVLIWVSLSLCGIALSLLGFKRYRLHRDNKQRREDFRKESFRTYRSTRIETETAYEQLVVDDPGPQVNLTADSFGTTEADRLRGLYRSYQTKFETAHSRYLALQNMPKTDEIEEDKTTQDYERGTEDYTTAGIAISEATHAYEVLIQELQSLQATAETVPERLSSIRQQLETLQTEATQFAEQGYFNLPSDELASVQQLLVSADAFITAGTPGKAFYLLNEAEETLGNARGQIGRLRVIRDDIKRRHYQQSQRLIALRRQLVMLRAQAAQLEVKFNEDSVAAPGALLDTAESKLTTAQPMLDSALDDSSMVRQAWDDASTSIDQVEDRLEKTGTTLQRAATKLTELDQLPDVMWKQTAELESVLANALSSITSMRGDQSATTAQLREVQTDLAAHRAQQRGAKPAFLVLRDDLTSLQARAKQIKEDIRKIHDTEVRRRRAATQPRTSPRRPSGPRPSGGSPTITYGGGVIDTSWGSSSTWGSSDPGGGSAGGWGTSDPGGGSAGGWGSSDSGGGSFGGW